MYSMFDLDKYTEFPIAGRVWDITRVLSLEKLRMKDDYIIVLLAEIVLLLRELNAKLDK